MDSKKIVCWPNVIRYYGDNHEEVARYKKIMEEGKCPFCPGNIKNDGREIVAKTARWNIIKNQFPYEGSELHLLIIPKRHITTLECLLCKEWSELRMVTNLILKKYSFLKNGYGLAARIGEDGGVTLYHLHLHLIAPKVDSEIGRIAINFGIG